MSEYQATYDALLEALRDPDFQQVFYDAARDALKDQRIAELAAILEKREERVMSNETKRVPVEWIEDLICTWENENSAGDMTHRCEDCIADLRSILAAAELRGLLERRPGKPNLVRIKESE